MHTIPEPLLIDDTLFIDNTSCEYIEACETMAHYALLLRRKSNKSANALTFGAAVHDALETWYKLTRGLGSKSPTTPTHVYDAFANSLLAESYAPEPNEYRTFSYGIELLERYLKRYPSEAWTVHTLNDKPLVETRFAVPLGELDSTPYGNLKVIWTGKIDLIVHSIDYGFMVIDHKTTSIFGEQFFAEFCNSSQMKGYCYAASFLCDTPINTALINALATRKPTKTGTAFDFGRDIYRYAPDVIEEWRLDRLSLIKNFLFASASGRFTHRTKNCVTKYGKCPYFDVCNMPIPARLNVLNSNLYKANTWNPLAQKET